MVEAVRLHVPADVIENADFFLHGTTVGLNALLERRGAKVGLITTEGFRDVLEIRRGDRAEMYNLFWHQPEPLVPRHLRLGVVERMTADGTVYKPLDEASVRAAVSRLQDANVDSIAVCLLHAYANPAHEARIGEIIRDCGFDGGISLSHRISGEYREYERTCTTVIDAFVRARMSHYLKRLDGRLRELGFRGSSLITRSGSGSMTFAEAEERPFETIMSGPVAGAEGASELARMLRHRRDDHGRRRRHQLRYRLHPQRPAADPLPGHGRRHAGADALGRCPFDRLRRRVGRLYRCAAA